MSLLSRLFGGGGGNAPAAQAQPEDHNGFAIYPEPIPEGPRWRVAARIEKDGKVHKLVRADTIEDEQTARDVSAAKARQMIDEQGDRIFT
ncbi:HlyU family transcriptional regulator [Psychromarinibacter halotolerans]|uniref:HlyU family transcriptional regulator n=1 Tax=Psychromarinibacter halotolerans TaxID=1775175 RepID=A0ABV7GTC3_9RHOB|nr:HlyU family transcriptional regulator [Psychromarinibacter halotolerans]MDF0598672.1 HlyU family transcriptional regulator [Psychromarinibacter halotolerans]